jgi:Protein of unknown function (DUF1592)/Protein of unknown function (DUF1588)/Protein of unknown function (DUF1587)/Protein of unknown function (DUF1585)/Protein of unknown function (DUF1595)/Planctomycete cytochrome C
MVFMSDSAPHSLHARSRLAAGVAGIALVALIATGRLGAQQSAHSGEAVFDSTVRPLLAEYCLDCHSSRRHKGDLDLERFTASDAVRQAPQVWDSVSAKLRLEEMPPPDEAQPTPQGRAALIAWIESELDAIAAETAGDPGPVLLRRLSNAEYTYTLRDLTGVDTLAPAREFPVDGAAGEGFTNVGNVLVMSPELLTKYFAAAKAIAEHAMLVEDGIRFSTGATRRDQTEALLADIRAFYRRYADSGGGEVVNLQGIVFSTNEGGLLPLARYLAATLELRDAQPPADAAAITALAAARGLSAKYLATLFAAVRDERRSPLLDPIRAQWRESSGSDGERLAAEIGARQKVLWKFNSVGHIGKAGGPKAWMEAVDPIVAAHEVSVAAPIAHDDGPVTFELIATDAGDSAAADEVVWRAPRFVAPGRPDLLLRDVRARVAQWIALRAGLARDVEALLSATATFESANDLAASASRHGLVEADLRAWLRYLGVIDGAAAPGRDLFSQRIDRPSEHEFVQGWGSAQTPLVLGNASDQFVQIPGDVPPRGIVVHPSPDAAVVVAFRSPVATTLKIDVAVQDAHLACGNGVEWAIELRRGSRRLRLASGVTEGGAIVHPGLPTRVPIHRGESVALIIGPRDREHTCDLTAVNLSLAEVEPGGRVWDLAAECASDLTTANPQPDRFGHGDVWSFATEPVSAPDPNAEIPAGSSLARWLLAADDAERAQCARELRDALATPSGTAPIPEADAELVRRLTAFDGPMSSSATNANATSEAGVAAAAAEYGLDPQAFGRDSRGEPIAVEDLCVLAPSVVEFRVPAAFVAGTRFTATGTLAPSSADQGSAQLSLRVVGSDGVAEHIPNVAPYLADPIGAAATRLRTAFTEFRDLFPPALCYSKIVPVDEVVTLTQFYREDERLVELMLDDEGARTLDRLWSDLRFVSQDALTQVDVFEQLYQFATQDADPKVFEPLREPIRAAAEVFRARMAAAEPKHLDAVVEFAERAWRRPLVDSEQTALRGLYRTLREPNSTLREAGLGHDEAIRLLLARTLISPSFLYRREAPAPGVAAHPVDAFELANRLSYFLWSSAPDAALREAAQSGRLFDDAELLAQTRRMLRDARVRRLAIEFGLAWLHLGDFESAAEKSERHFPTFPAVRDDLNEEVVCFFTAFFTDDAPVRDLLDADYTFLSRELAEHYAIPGVGDASWPRVEGVKAHSRGGILGFGATLAAQAGASRTSPILRGNWVSEVLLGEKLPRPPPDIPKLPDDEATEHLSVRQMVERHSKDPSCAVCHHRIDAFGFALEGFDAIGRRRDADLAGHSIDVRATMRDGATLDGLAGLREYLRTTRKDAFDVQFCRKLLGYALGRSVRLSDRALLREMSERMRADGARIGDLVAAIVLSPQFRKIRGRDHGDENPAPPPEAEK